MAEYSVSEARAKLNEVIALAQNEAVEIKKHGKAVVTILDSMKYENLLDYIEDLEDRIAILEFKMNPNSDSKSWEEVQKELGLGKQKSSMTTRHLQQ